MAFQETARLGEEGMAAGRLAPEEVLRNAWTLAPQIPPNCWGHASKFAQRDACSRSSVAEHNNLNLQNDFSILMSQSTY